MPCRKNTDADILSAVEPSANRSLEDISAEARQCRLCEKYLPCAPRPVFRISSTARILIVGQAPGIRVHESGIPWNDPSGDRLRKWLQIEREEFYDVQKIAIIPTGLCYPGTGEGGDLPPRPECAPLWHPQFISVMPAIRLTLLVGSYAQAFYLNDRKKRTLTETVAAWQDYLPAHIPLPHPSPRNIRWFKAHPWFEKEVVPTVRDMVHQLLKV